MTFATKISRKHLCALLVGSLAVASLATPRPALGQLGAAAGVRVDADGVLRVHRVTDPTGQLTRQRIEQLRAALDADIAKSSKLRKISLNRLEAALAENIAIGAGPTQDMQFLAGLTRIRYVFCYPETGDIVIAGPAEGYAVDAAGRAIGITSGHSVVELQDLVAALRMFRPDAQPTELVTCSIDPTQEGLQAMRQFLVDITGRVRPSDAPRIAAGLREHLGLQNVTLQGVSAKTHFAQVLVEADYRMKLIGIGLEEPPVNIGSYVHRASPANVARNALQRWWFVPNYESVRVSEDELSMELVGDGVKLVGANEIVSADGVRSGTNHVDRASNAFVTTFTQKYPELARRSPVFAQLRNLIDLAVAAAHIQQQDYYSQTNWQALVFGSEDVYPIEVYETPQKVESAVNAVWKGNILMTPVGGGVQIQPLLALSSENLLYDEQAELAEQRANIEKQQPASKNWWWD